LQFGYALGILVFVPLADLVQRRRLVVMMFALVALGLVAVAAAPSITALALAFMAVGVTTTAAQILLPFAADLALPEHRGKVLGTVQTGLIMGTLLARTVGGLIGEHCGWRALFGLAAAIAASATFVLARVLPARAPTVRMSYRDLIGSLPGFVARFPALRITMGLGFLSFSVFAGLWTVLAFHLRELGYGADYVGGLGLVSFIGVFTVARAGALADRRGTLVAGALGWVLTVASFVSFLVAGGTLAGLAVACALMAVGTQINQVSNQTRIFALDDSARSRINTIYMFSNFIGGASGALLASWSYDRGGWEATCWAMLVSSLLMLPFLLWYRRIAIPAALRSAPGARSS
jgi:predicted MFS family arabinose efflux permease